MKLLALDTSSNACSVSLQLGEDVIENHVVGAREHTRILMPMIRGVLEDGAVSLAELDAIVLGNGPGSFIGMRIGASVAQGLAHGAGINIVPVSSLPITISRIMVLALSIGSITSAKVMEGLNGLRPTSTAIIITAAAASFVIGFFIIILQNPEDSTESAGFLDCAL